MWLSLLMPYAYLDAGKMACADPCAASITQAVELNRLALHRSCGAVYGRASLSVMPCFAYALPCHDDRSCSPASPRVLSSTRGLHDLSSWHGKARHNGQRRPTIHHTARPVQRESVQLYGLRDRCSAWISAGHLARVQTSADGIKRDSHLMQRQTAAAATDRGSQRQRSSQRSGYAMPEGEIGA